MAPADCTVVLRTPWWRARAACAFIRIVAVGARLRLVGPARAFGLAERAADWLVSGITVEDGSR